MKGGTTSEKPPQRPAGRPSPTPVHQAVAVLARGGIIAHPTETVYGLAVDPDNESALLRLSRLKGRSVGKGFILLVSGLPQLAGLVRQPLSPLAKRLVDRFWPGPLTLVLPALPGLSPLLTGGTGRVAVRQSPSEMVATLLRLWQKPLVSTSANVSGGETPRRGGEVRAFWGKRVDLVLDGESGGVGQPSTVVRVDLDRVWLLRAGAMPLEQLLPVVPRLVLPDGRCCH